MLGDFFLETCRFRQIACPSLCLPTVILWSPEPRPGVHISRNNMATVHVSNHLRANRRRLGLSQDELAFLLGAGSGAKVSRYERLIREPNLRTVLAFEVIFDKSASHLFSRFCKEVQKDIALRARFLRRRIAAQEIADQSSRKNRALTRMITIYSKPR